MNEGKVFLLQDDSSLLTMTNQTYESEDLLQTLLADYPDLLAGEQMNRVAPRQWVLVRREAGVPSREAGGDQWSMDHLFLDQDGVPTIVEVKRSSDTRIRREVVGQMLDYAANAVAYWPVGRIRAMFEETCREQGQSPAVVLSRLWTSGFAEEMTAENFWQDVDRNLQARKVRLVFVADQIPVELQRIVEFLNEQMNPAEVLAVEIRQYVGQGAKTLVPRVYGLTAVAQTTKTQASLRRPWDRDRYMEVMEQKQGARAVAVARQVLSWAEVHGWTIAWGSGAVDGSLRPRIALADVVISPFTIFTSGVGQIHLAPMSSAPPFDSAAKVAELRSKLQAIPGINLSQAEGWPSFQLVGLYDPANLASFLDTFRWVETEMRRLSATPS